MVIDEQHLINEDRIQNRIDLQSRQIEQVFDHNGYPVQVISGSVQSNKQLFNIRSSLAGGWQRFQDTSQKLVDDMKQALRVKSVKLNRSPEGHLQLQIVRSYDPPVPLQELLRLAPKLGPATAVLGLDETGRLVTHNFRDEATPNLFILGGPDSGKTVLLRSIITSLVQHNRQADVQMILISPIHPNRQKQQATAEIVKPLDLLPHMVTDVITRTSEMIDLLSFLQGELRYRQKQKFNNPQIILMIDSAATVLNHGGPTLCSAVHQIAEQGPDVGIHLVVASKSPGDDVFSPHLVTNLQTKIIGQFRDNNKPASLLGEEADEAAYLLGAGDFLLVQQSGAVRFQGAFIDNYDLHMVLNKLHKPKPILLAKPYQQRISFPASPQEAKKRKVQFVDEMVSVR